MVTSGSHNPRPAGISKTHPPRAEAIGVSRDGRSRRLVGSPATHTEGKIRRSPETDRISCNEGNFVEDFSERRKGGGLKVRRVADLRQAKVS
jgi:hypothetical protein